MRVEPRTARTISWIATVVAVAVAVVLPLGYFVLSYQRQAGALDAEAEVNGRIASQVINANPELWRFQQSKLKEFLSRRPRHGYAESRRILDTEKKVIAESVDSLAAPLLTRSVELRDSGVVVGRIEISRSLRPLLLRTGLVGLLGLLLGAAVFATLRLLPLRALDRALEDNTRLLEESQRRYREMQTLQEISQTLLTSWDLRATLENLLDKTMSVGSFDLGIIRLLDPRTGMLQPMVSRGYQDPKSIEMHRKMARDLVSQEFVLQEMRYNKPHVEENVPQCSGLRTMKREGIQSAVIVPVRAEEEMLGILQLGTRSPRKFQSGEIHLLETIGNQIGVAVQKARLYEEIRSRAVELEKANKVKDEFLGFVSHELRAPLNAVIAYTIMMQDRLLGEINPEQGQTLVKMLGYSNDLLGMINSLLEVTRIEAGRVEVESHKVDLSRFLEDLKYAYDTPTGKPLTLNWDFPSDLPSVRTDSAKLRHILQNLITNAIKYTERGSVSVSARWRPEGGNIQFRVSDTGIGIPEEFLPVIFEMFRQVKRPDGHPSSGVGLGLHIVKQFTEMIGGKIDVESEVGEGSTFKVTIPCAIQTIAEQGTDGFQG